MNTNAPLWLVAVPLVVSPLIYLSGQVDLRRRKSVTDRALAARWVALAVLLATCLLFAWAAANFLDQGPAQFTLGMAALRFDGMSLLLSGLAVLLGTLAVLFSGPYMAGEAGEEKYYALVVIMTGAMVGLSMAADLFNLWFWFETMTVSSFLLVAFYREERNSLEAGFKYLVQSAVGSVLVLMGVALVLADTGTLDLNAIQANAGQSELLLAAGALFVIGFGVKIALVPAHTWLPDAHAQAPSGISAMLSGVVIEAGLVALLRALFPLAGVTLSWGPLLLGFGAVNMLVGNLLALRQTQVKRLLAYSSVSHVGYMLLGLGISLSGGEAAGAQGGLFHLLNHGLMKGLAFLAAGALLYGLRMNTAGRRPLILGDLAGAARRYPLAAVALTVSVLGLAGVPPLAGFMSKWQIFAAGFASPDALLHWLVAFGALNSLLSLGYYLPLVNALVRQPGASSAWRGPPLPFSMAVPLVLLTLAVVVVGLWPGLVSWLVEPSAAAVMAALGR